MIRAFIAIELPDDVRVAVSKVQARLKQAQAGARVSWTKIENAHLTLQFLGNIEAAEVSGISDLLATVAGNFSAFDVPVVGTGAFPDAIRPQVLWIGCDDPNGKLRALAGAVTAALHTGGFQSELAEWVAHLTLGRIKVPRRDAALTRALDSLTNEVFGTLRVGAIHLFQSQLHPDGSIYTKLSSHLLKEIDYAAKN